MYIQLEESLKKKYLSLIKANAEQNSLQAVRYLALGPITVRLLCFADRIVPTLEKLFTYVLREDVEYFDSTIALYNEKATSQLAESLYFDLSAPLRMKVKAEMMWIGIDRPNIQLSDKNGMDTIVVNGVDEITKAYDESSRTYYCGISGFELEESEKIIYIFRRLLYDLVKKTNVRLVHGAVMGYKENGFLLCGRGKRGKSTLTVNAMLHGFDYVADDFQIIEKKETGLCAYPVYSVINLSHKMYEEMYDSFNGKFISNNFEHNKYYCNISAYHNQFRSAYPVRFCLFPEIVSDKDPSMHLCGPEEKGRAIVQLIHSTAAQMHAENNADDLSSLFKMIHNLPFYKICLCKNIAANTEYLRNFLETNIIPSSDNQLLPRVLKDISFSLATFLDTDNFKIYTMNKLATEVYRLLCSGVSEENIRLQLKKYTVYNKNIIKESDALFKAITLYGFYDKTGNVSGNYCIQDILAEKSGYHLSVFDYSCGHPKELLKIKE